MIFHHMKNIDRESLKHYHNIVYTEMEHKSKEIRENFAEISNLARKVKLEDEDKRFINSDEKENNIKNF